MSISLIYINVVAIKADFNGIFERAKFVICTCGIKAYLILIAEVRTV